MSGRKGVRGRYVGEDGGERGGGQAINRGIKTEQLTSWHED